MVLRARRKAVELRAAKHNAKSDAEKEALQAVYAYEEVLSKKHGRRTDSETLNRYGMGLHIIELAKNALDYGDVGSITALFTHQCVNITVEDNGPGIDNPLWVIDTSISGGFDLRNAFLFADSFVIETRGRKYEKIGESLASSGLSDVKKGTKVTCVALLSREMHDSD